MASDKYEEKYTKPDLRRQLKQDIKESDKGGKPGQWSARKSQMLVQAYEKEGGGYRKDHKDEAAQSLEEWTAQNWQTKEGEGDAQQDGLMKRYLPEAVWDRLSGQEQKAAERTKQSGDAQGEQYVSWTPAIKRAMAEAGYAPDGSEADGQTVYSERPQPLQQKTVDELYQQAQDLDIQGRSDMNKDELVEAVAAAQTEQMQEQSLEELYQQAQDLDIQGRSNMNKDELIEALLSAGALV